ncbi:MAG TPA: extracellular solute-binding protein [Geminicoccus sp.]|uniref:extracellular solute-binding protein n=1 Tax=Geminicoccus sp. TaxID=2024832 RepID=UPI002E30C2E9|nr:extracellular solute-binding protein [Geminicoccus sp.]HEX2525025.1 extracellular solute-binding protein [Geminicoccus sp.]
MSRRHMMLAAALAAGASICPRGAARADARLTYWHPLTSQSEFAGLQRIISMFQSANAGSSIVQENIPNSEFMAKVTSAVLTQSQPDTLMVLAERIDDLVAMEGLVDLSDRIESWNLKGNFPQTAWDTITRDGKIYGAPAFTFVDWIYYRTDWFQDAGIDGPPKTMEEFADIAEKLTDPSKGRYGYGMRGGQGGDTYMVSVLRQFGALQVQDGRGLLDRQLAIEAVDYWTGLATKRKAVPPSAAGDSYRQVMEGFRTGQTGMIWHHTGSLVEISQALKQGEQFMTAQVPAGPANAYRRVSYGYNGLMRDTQADEAWKWASYWGEVEPEIAMLEATGYFPASTEALKHPRVADNPVYKAASDTLPTGEPPPSFIGSNHWREDVVLPAMQSVLIGSATVEQAVDVMMKGLDDA